MRVMVLGGDGFCGWPTSLHLSNIGNEVAIVDNLSRRNIDNELEAGSLTPIQPLSRRIEAWKAASGRGITFHNLDVAQDYHRLVGVIRDWQPEVIVHFAEQRAAPYSMKSAAHKRYTVSNNVNATHNLLVAVLEAGIQPHIVHLGTMGVYGYGSHGMEIPEGYLKVMVPTGRDEEMFEEEILHPAKPGSVYHLTKTLDQLMFAFYAKNDQLRITDLHQGIVWGTETSDTRQDEILINRFDYDGDYGTVLNRFLAQAAIDYPLTVHGTGGQTRAFVNIQDTVRCIELAIESPPQRGEQVKIMNQMTECHTILSLAGIVSGMTGVPIEHVENPRKEAAANDLMVSNSSLINLGLKPITLEDSLASEVMNIAKKYAHNIDKTKIPCVSRW